MNENNIDSLYDEEEARNWNQRLLKEKDRIAFEIKILERLTRNANNWLDVACGSGFFLSQFNNIRRAGFDKSSAMVKLARRENPDAMFICEGDYRDDCPEWTGQWELVSCMWQAYCYVNTMTEFEQVIHNLANWTAKNGTCFVPFGAPFGKKPAIPYQRDAHSVWGGKVIQPGVIWSWVDEQTGKTHKNLIEPHPEHMSSLFNFYFDDVDIIEYPNEGLFAVVATGKKEIPPGSTAVGNTP